MGLGFTYTFFAWLTPRTKCVSKIRLSIEKTKNETFKVKHMLFEQHRGASKQD